MKKAVVFDNSGTLIERYRVIKDVINGNIFTDINSLDLIDQADALTLVVLQFNTNKKGIAKIKVKNLKKGKYKLNYLDFVEVEDSYFTGWYSPMRVELPCYPPYPRGSLFHRLNRLILVLECFSLR